MSKTVAPAADDSAADPDDSDRIRQYLINCYLADPFGTAKYFEEFSRLPAGSISLVDPELPTPPRPKALPAH